MNMADKFIDTNYNITWIGTKRGIENKLIKNENIKLKYITSTGIRGKSFFGKVKGLLNFIKAFFQCYIIIRKEKPIFILGFGGYISTSASLASFFCITYTSCPLVCRVFCCWFCIRVSSSSWGCRGITSWGSCRGSSSSWLCKTKNTCERRTRINKMRKY